MLAVLCLFRREPYVEKGGPNGGNGGRGGHVWAVAEEGLNSLLSFRNKAHFRATNGSAGQRPGIDLPILLAGQQPSCLLMQYHWHRD